MHPAELAQFITAFGNLGVILPVAVMVALVVAAAGDWRSSFLWALAVSVSLGLILVAKLYFIPCGDVLPVLGIHSPSGHSASAAAVYGGAAVLVARMTASRRTTVFLVLIATTILVLAVAVSRVVIGVHTIPEVILGSAIGLAAPTILATAARGPSRKVALRPWMLILPLLPIVLLRGIDLHAEEVIDTVAYRLAHHFGVCSAGRAEAGTYRIAATAIIGISEDHPGLVSGIGKQPIH